MNVTERFSSRVSDYIKYRPGYPADLVDFLVREARLERGAPIVDVGSGTGIFSELLLRRGFTVYGVEPNREMRGAAERLLAGYSNFHSVDGTAESTGLPDACADVYVAAQAYHWFDAPRARAEAKRILKRGGLAALVWNDRKIDTTPFLAAYDELLRSHGTDYEQVNHRNVDASRLDAFFGPSGYRETVFPNAQHFDWEGLYGRAMSSSYVPAEGHPKHLEFTERLRHLFDVHADAERVTIEYDTRLFLGAP